MARGRAVGFVVGMIRGDRREVKAYGASDRAPLSPDTIMEIGSITKTFTGILLAEMVSRGEVGLEDPVGRFLPGTTPQRGPGAITLLDLATHTSGLPTNGGILLRQALRNRWEPFARFTTEDLVRQVSAGAIRRRIGRFGYSNVGFGLLGHVLGIAAGRSYEELVVDRVCRPLGLPSTVPEIPQHASSRVVRGHARGGRAVPDLTIPALPAAGVLRSTVRDMVAYLRAHLRPEATALPEAIRKALGPHRTFRRGGMGVGLGWLRLRHRDRTLVWHNGGTPGFGAFAALDPGADAGLVILSNSRYLYRMTRAGFRMLDRLAAPT